MNELKERAFALLNSWTTGEASLVAAHLAPEFEEIDRPQQAIKGLAGLNDKLSLFHKLHTNVTVKVRKQLADGDIVCTQWLILATLKSADGLETATPTIIYQPGISWTYFSNGKIVKNRIYRDIVGYMLQHGYKWAPPGATASSQKETQS